MGRMSIDQEAMDELSPTIQHATHYKPSNNHDPIAVETWQKYFGDYAFINRDGMRPLIANEYCADLTQSLQQERLKAKLEELRLHLDATIVNRDRSDAEGLDVHLYGKLADIFDNRIADLTKQLKKYEEGK